MHHSTVALIHRSMQQFHPSRSAHLNVTLAGTMASSLVGGAAGSSLGSCGRGVGGDFGGGERQQKMELKNPLGFDFLIWTRPPEKEKSGTDSDKGIRLRNSLFKWFKCLVSYRNISPTGIIKLFKSVKARLHCCRRCSNSSVILSSQRSPQVERQIKKHIN